MSTGCEDAWIRPATVADYEALCRLTEVVDRWHVAIVPEVFREFAGPARTRDAVAAWVEAPDADYLVAEASGAVVGFLSIKRASHPRHPMFRPHEFALIENMAVAEEWRRRGVATALLAAARRWARERGLRAVQLTVWAANAPALALYKKEGFRPLHCRMELQLEEEPS